MVDTTRIPASELVEDYSLYPRHAVDDSHVADIARAITSGVDLNNWPIIADAISKRVVDGFHRRRAWQKVHGLNVEVAVELREYPDEAALLQDAISLNAAHGRRLDKQDRTRSAMLLQERGVSVEQISIVLHSTPAYTEKLLTRVVIVKDDDDDPGERYPAKPIAYPSPAGETRELNPEQYRVMRSSSGYRTAQQVTQLTNELEIGLVELDTPGLKEKLARLAEVIAGVV